jgi:hypothetical protein
MNLEVGARLRSQTCTTEVIVVRPPTGDVDLRCGGLPMVPLDEPTDARPPEPAHSGGTLLGKRYADEDSGLELLCTKAGQGSLSLTDTPLEPKQAKPLPSSD